MKRDENPTEYTIGLEVENVLLRQALRQARAWGVKSEGFSADQSRKLADWIDAGMTGPLPEIPDYYTK